MSKRLAAVIIITVIAALAAEIFFLTRGMFGYTDKGRSSESVPPVPIPTADIAFRAVTALENSVTVDAAAVELYISQDGDVQAVRDTLMKIQTLSDEICGGISDDKERLRAISAWVAQNIYYDYDARNSSVTAETISLAHILETRRTVCMGFANICAALAMAQGIDCRVVHGASSGDEPFSDQNSGNLHEWNVAVIDGVPVWMDSLWDGGNQYFRGEYYDGDFEEKYFDMELSVISEDHRADRIEIRDYFAAKGGVSSQAASAP